MTRIRGKHTPPAPAPAKTPVAKANVASNMPPAPPPRDTWVTGDNGKSVFVPASQQAQGGAAVTPQPPRSTGPTTTIDFGSDWSETPQGQLQAGGRLTLNYDINRLSSLRNSHNGYPAWGISAYVKFEPSGQLVEGPVMQFKSDLGRPTNEPLAAPLTVDIPQGTTGVQVWFKNWTGADSPREAYDSNFGQNYHFDVRS